MLKGENRTDRFPLVSNPWCGARYFFGNVQVDQKEQWVLGTNAGKELS